MFFIQSKKTEMLTVSGRKDDCCLLTICAAELMNHMPYSVFSLM